jgi:hypothetical protein
MATALAESIKFVAFSFVMRFSFELIQAGLSGGNSSQSLFENERNLQLDAVFRDLSLIVQFDLLILDPCGLEVLERFLSARDAYLYRIIKTLCGRRYDFSYFCD